MERYAFYIHTIHYITFHYITLQYITCIIIHYITCKYTTLHLNTLRYIYMHYITFLYMTFITFIYIALHCMALRCVALHCIALRCIALASPLHIYIKFHTHTHIYIYIILYIYIYICVYYRTSQLWTVLKAWFPKSLLRLLLLGRGSRAMACSAGWCPRMMSQESGVSSPKTKAANTSPGRTIKSLVVAWQWHIKVESLDPLHLWFHTGGMPPSHCCQTSPAKLVGPRGFLWKRFCMQI